MDSGGQRSRDPLFSKRKKVLDRVHPQCGNGVTLFFNLAIRLVEAMRSAGVESMPGKARLEISEEEDANWLKIWAGTMKPLPKAGLPDDFRQ